MFSYISPEKRVPADHPLRPIRKLVDEILKEMSPKFAKVGRVAKDQEMIATITLCLLWGGLSGSPFSHSQLIDNI